MVNYLMPKEMLEENEKFTIIMNLTDGPITIKEAKKNIIRIMEPWRKLLLTIIQKG